MMFAASRLLLDHLVRAKQRRLQDRQPERLGGFQVDDQLVLGRKFDRKVAGVRPFEYPVYVNRPGYRGGSLV